MSVKLNDVATGRDNNFNLLRMIAASAVLISHAYPISLGEGTVEPLAPLLKLDLGTLAVIAFFAISGFFISQSFDRRYNLISFCVARILRIYPGLIISLLLAVLVIGPIFTSMTVRAYFLDHQTLLYFPRNLSLKWLQYGLPGVFNGNPYPNAVNGSLWSLFYEVVCYGLVVLVGSPGLVRRSWSFSAFLGIYVIAYMSLRPIVLRDHSHGLSFIAAIFQQLTLPFILGMTLYRFRRFLPLSWGVLMLAGSAAAFAYDTSWFREIFVVFWCYLIFCLGYLGFSPLHLYNRLGDYSYGMYIYAFPCEQIGAALWRGISPLGLISVSFPATLAIAVLSWHVVEGRALAQRAAAADWLERTLRRRTALTQVLPHDQVPRRRFWPSS